MINELTPRERDVVRELCISGNNEAIGRALNIAVPTVKRHLSTIMEKAGVYNRVLIALWAVRNGYDA